MAEWKIVVKDKYPAYIDWESFERIQAMLRDNHAEYDRNKTRGAAPRWRRAAPGHCLVRAVRPQDGRAVQEQATAIICNHLHRLQGDPVCQHLPADPIDARVVAAFFAAVTPAELEAWRRAHDARCQADEALDRAEAQQVERLRYQALLAERQFNKVDPDNRLVAGELERRWEAGTARAAPGRGRAGPAPGEPAPRRRRCRLKTGRAFWRSPRNCQPSGSTPT